MRHNYILGIRLTIALAIALLGGYAFMPSSAGALDSPASLTLNVYTCDRLHDPIDPNQTLLNECALGTDDIAFTLEPLAPQRGGMMASTGTGGSPATISFSELASGLYRLSLESPPTIAQSYVATCTSNVRTFDYPFTPFAIIEPNGRLNIELLPDEQLTCDWFNILAPEQEPATSLTVTVYDCNGDVIGPDVCEPAPGVELRLFSASAEVLITADANGIATFDGEGTFEIEPVSELEERVFCSFQTASSDVVDVLTLDLDNPIAIEAYYCYPGA